MYDDGGAEARHESVRCVLFAGADEERDDRPG